MDCRLSTRQNRTLRSALPLASRRPSGLNATAFTLPPCPDKVATHCEFSNRHKRTASSSRRRSEKLPLPLASSRPSGLKATAFTRPAVPYTTLDVYKRQAHQRLEIYRRPSAEGYRQILYPELQEQVAPVLLPELVFSVEQLFIANPPV